MFQRAAFGHGRYPLASEKPEVGTVCMMRGLSTIKAVVIGLGLGIIGLTILIVMVVIDKAGDTVSDATAPAVDASAYADVAVALPAGATVVAMTGEGDALSLLLTLADGGQQVVTIDRRSGEVLGTLELLPRNP
jgi:hypothetical protein